jgi:hypothetical protein
MPAARRSVWAVSVRRRTFLALGGAAAVALVAAACGSVTRAGRPSQAPAPSFAADQPVITFVIRPGANPLDVGRRIAGPTARVNPAYRDNAGSAALRRVFVVAVQPGDEQPALSRAQSDPDVQQAWFGRHLGA